jgi:hypothetical protein
MPMGRHNRQVFHAVIQSLDGCAESACHFHPPGGDIRL